MDWMVAKMKPEKSKTNQKTFVSNYAMAQLGGVPVIPGETIVRDGTIKSASGANVPTYLVNDDMWAPTQTIVLCVIRPDGYDHTPPGFGRQTDDCLCRVFWHGETVDDAWAMSKINSWAAVGSIDPIPDNKLTNDELTVNVA